MAASHVAAIGVSLPTGSFSSVDPHYMGTNVALLYDILRRVLGPTRRSQYETADQFSKKLDTLKQLTLIGNHRLGDQFTFVVGGVWNGEGSVV